MTAAEGIVAAIDAAFTSPHPGDAFLQGSFDGCEPYEEVSALAGCSDWRALDPAFLDARYCALGFLSEAGLRFFLPAFMTADLRNRLLTADPAFHLTHGFHELAVDTTGPDGAPLSHRSGGPVLLGPRRYGAITWEDAARHRLSVFCREEAAAIVAYLEWRSDPAAPDRPAIEAALQRFWRERARSAPARAALDVRAGR